MLHIDRRFDRRSNEPGAQAPTNAANAIRSWSNRPEAMHPQALTQRYGNLSIHTASIVRPLLVGLSPNALRLCAPHKQSILP